MSYSIIEAKGEEMGAMNTAIEQRDSEGLFRLARIAKKAGRDELSEYLYFEAKKIDREDMAFDENRDNNL